jgi:hypothetical protein
MKAWLLYLVCRPKTTDCLEAVPIIGTGATLPPRGAWCKMDGDEFFCGRCYTRLQIIEVPTDER